ncbi:MAG: hypothetical protein CM15mP52_0930 [Candidatus Neomarinimicrobiota bacterium]|nr:MAG: hypothetical protein CM15mP52_0930 [Candidatus Neomarinimicrobiota bacterium]
MAVSRAVVSSASGKIEVSDVTSTELSYLDGVTSAVQTQLDAKQPADDDLTDLADGTLSASKVENNDILSLQQVLMDRFGPRMEMEQVVGLPTQQQRI